MNTIESVVRSVLEPLVKTTTTGLLGTPSFRRNLLDNSNDFSTAPWLATDSTIAIDAGVTDPFGTNRAWKWTSTITSDEGAAGIELLIPVAAVPVDTQRTWSIYAKGNSLTNVRINAFNFDDPFAPDIYLMANLSTGLPEQNEYVTSYDPFNVDPIEEHGSWAITALPNGWWRISFTITQIANHDYGLIFIALDEEFFVDTGDFCHVFCAQVENGTLTQGQIT